MPRLAFLLLLLLAACGTSEMSEQRFAIPQIDFEPRLYSCQKAEGPLKIDGSLKDPAWQKAAWTTPFVDIEGPAHPTPTLRTRAKMLWDDRYFYIAAELSEPHVWGTLTRRDSIIYHDNDFEVFIDPDGDTHNYYELEINALNTVWDLFLVKPYRDGGPALHAWDIAGLQHAVEIQGTLNDPSDVDTRWTVELAIPWKILEEAAGTRCPPEPGDRWRVNFSRVQWPHRIVEGKYLKPSGAKENNWVWSPQGLINMHYPEMWGIVVFGAAADGLSNRERAAWRLRQDYYNMRRAGGRRFSSTRDGLEIRHDGRIVKIR